MLQLPKLDNGLLAVGALIILGLLSKFSPIPQLRQQKPSLPSLRSLIGVLVVAYLSSLVIGSLYIFWALSFNYDPYFEDIIRLAQDTNTLLLQEILIESVVLVVILFFFIRVTTHTRAAVGLSMGGMTVKGLVGASLVGLGGLWIIMIARYIIAGFPAAFDPRIPLWQSLDLPYLFLGIAWGGTAGVVVEELIFRGILYSCMRERLGVYLGIGVSSLLFALAHANSSLSVFFVGCVLAAIYERTGSLYPSMIAHGVNNLIVLTIWSQLTFE